MGEVGKSQMCPPHAPLHALEQHLAFAKEFARHAGAVMRENFRLGLQKAWKEDRTPVTDTDELINRDLVRAVKESYPTFAVKGEEEDHFVDHPDTTWVCDPLDGTFPFTSGIPIATFALALVDNDGVPQLGLIYDPFSDRLLHAVTGSGAFLNGTQVRVSDKETLDGAVVDFEVWPGRAPIANRRLREELIHLGAWPLTLCSVIFASALTAAGAIDGVIMNLPKPEDAAAAKVIVDEAGGKVTDLRGNEQSYLEEIHGAIVSGVLLHQQLVDLVNR